MVIARVDRLSRGRRAFDLFRRTLRQRIRRQVAPPAAQRLIPFAQFRLALAIFHLDQLGRELQVVRRTTAIASFRSHLGLERSTGAVVTSPLNPEKTEAA